MTTPAEHIEMPSDMETELTALRAEKVILSRKLARLQDTIDWNKSVAESNAAVAAMQGVEKRRQEQFMTMLLENSPNIILLFTRSGHLAYCTQKFLKLSGVSGFAEINGQHFRSIFYKFADKNWVDDFGTLLRSAVDADKSTEQEIRLNISGQEERIYVLQCVPSLHVDGVVMMLHDVTDIRSALEKAEYEKARAEQASVAKSVFLSNMSHEIRTPLNAIIGMTSLVKGTGEEQKRQYYVSKIEEASTHLLGVINDILDISKIEANKFELSLSVFSFERMLQRVVSISNFRVEEKKQNLTMLLDSHLPAMIESDEQHLAQVITNLLSNAIKFTPEGGKIRLGSQLLAESDGICTILISVTDTGIGIPTESQDRIFHSFEQMDNSVSRKFGGTGLGLTISKRIVEMMNGTIRVESVPGEGATFSFTIKARRCQAHEFHEITFDSSVVITNKEGIFEGKRLLYAEDVKINREIIIAQLAVTKVKIDCAVNGREAVERFKECGGKYDLIFMDMQMPEMDGIEATIAIRALDLPAAKTVPIIALTANVFRDDIEKCLAAGMNGHLGKPIKFPVMLQKMRSYLNRDS